jgi:ascorbate-specific PTS system EIIC-type component UlaA
MDSEVVLEILFRNKSNKSFVFDKVLNLNSNNLSDWIEFYRHNSFIDVLIVFMLFLFYVVATQIKKKFHIETDSKEPSINNTQQNDNKLVYQ